MKHAKLFLLSAVIAVFFVVVTAGHVLAMTPEQQVLYDAWYRARFGIPASSGMPPQPTPAQPDPAQPSVPRPVLPQTPAKGTIQSVQPNAFEQGMLTLLNEQREKSKCGPVRLDPYISAVARVKAEDMINNNYYGHGSSYGYSGTLLSHFGISVRLSRENICQASTFGMAHNVFMGSTSHRENMLKPWWTGVGIGVVKKPGSSLYYVVEIFVQK